MTTEAELAASVEHLQRQLIESEQKRQQAESELRALEERHLFCIARDMAERNRLEAQLLQSRKMEAIGILAGAVAHDFNNLLAIMVTYTSFALDALKPEDAARTDIENVAKAAERAVALTRQLLAFSRQQVPAPVVIELNAMLASLEPALRRLLAKNIDLKLVMGPSLGQVSAGPGQLEQVIMNLVVNAYDAMPDGGKLTIETANVSLNPAAQGQAGTEAGDYVKLTLSDTGLGVDSATLARIFEPFFTTKGGGDGTGLGLSMVLGIVQQSGGHVVVRSEPGKGTTFEILLPRVERPVAVPTPPVLTIIPPLGGETVLVVDDDEHTRALARTVLRRNGYEVLLASNADEGLALAERHVGPIHLLLTGLVMPAMGGCLLAERLAALRPDIKVLFMSGPADATMVQPGLLDADVALMQKPITPLGLARGVRALLDARSHHTGH